MQIETPGIRGNGCPCETTRTVPTIHCPVTHGPLPAIGTKAQPAITYGAVMVAAGIPETSTTGLSAVGTACPPCEHSTVAPICKIGPGMPSHLVVVLLKQQAQMIVKAPIFTSTEGPTMVIIAPLPL